MSQLVRSWFILERLLYFHLLFIIDLVLLQSSPSTCFKVLIGSVVVCNDCKQMKRRNKCNNIGRFSLKYWSNIKRVQRFPEVSLEVKVPFLYSNRHNGMWTKQLIEYLSSIIHAFETRYNIDLHVYITCLIPRNYSRCSIKIWPRWNYPPPSFFIVENWSCYHFDNKKIPIVDQTLTTDQVSTTFLSKFNVTSVFE